MERERETERDRYQMGGRDRDRERQRQRSFLEIRSKPYTYGCNPLHSQADLWYSLSWVKFLCTVHNIFFFFFLFNLIIDVATFHLGMWYTLGVFLLLAFAYTGHGCQDCLSLCNGMHACTDYTSEGVELKPMLAQKKISPQPDGSKEGQTCGCIMQHSKPSKPTIIIIINLIYIAQFDINGILTALYIVITYIQM